MLPKEHGAWVMLLMPYLVGTAVAGGGGWASLLLLISVLLLFTSSRSLELSLQKPADPEGSLRRYRAIQRLAAYLTLGAGSGLLLLLLYDRWTLMAIGAVAGAALAMQLLLRRWRLDRTWPARLLSIAALSATGPAAYYAATGSLDSHAAAVGWLAFLYSGASIFYVRVFHPASTRRQIDACRLRAESIRRLAAYTLFAAVAAVSLAWIGQLPWAALLAFVPLALKAVRIRFHPDRHPSLREIGFAEIRHTALFALLVIAALVTWR